MNKEYLNVNDAVNYLGKHVKYTGNYKIPISCDMIPKICNGINIPSNSIGKATNADPNRPINDIKRYLELKGIKLHIDTSKYSIYSSKIKSLDDWVNTLPVNRIITAEMHVNGTMDVISKYINEQLSKIPKEEVGDEVEFDKYRPRNDIIKYLENVNVFLKQQ